ncbi:hypothetical protein CYMTET_53128 [Cymbomonas tetramitiformis]|uniref:Uncharacterized protein n=1 Tax=Cymbomonas tetramitiformis TaxID=36881 RepID=A0AAE0BIY0_9CHLO|nr:hypothetical protein CYMTET_53128 [Cymbomonas tetramitiformis]
MLSLMMIMILNMADATSTRRSISSNLPDDAPPSSSTPSSSPSNPPETCPSSPLVILCNEDEVEEVCDELVGATPSSQPIPCSFLDPADVLCDFGGVNFNNFDFAHIRREADIYYLNWVRMLANGVRNEVDELGNLLRPPRRPQNIERRTRLSLLAELEALASASVGGISLLLRDSKISAGVYEGRNDFGANSFQFLEKFGATCSVIFHRCKCLLQFNGWSYTARTESFFDVVRFLPICSSADECDSDACFSSTCDSSTCVAICWSTHGMLLIVE